LQRGIRNAHVLFRDARQYAAKIGRDRQIAAFVQRIFIESRPAPVNAAAAHISSQQPHHIAMTMVRAAIAVFTERATEFR